jgi:hypothetical protein
VNKKIKMTLLKSWTVPIEVYNEASGKYANQHWRLKSKRHKRQQWEIKSFLKEIEIFRDKAIIIKLIRINPRMMDTGDNLPYSFKWVRDKLADMIYPGLKAGRADDTDLIEWEYRQEKGKSKEKAIRVEVYELR